MSDGPIVFFDGVCNLCNGAVQWILRHEEGQAIRFAPLQSTVAERLLGGSIVESMRRDPALASLTFLDDKDRLHLRSDAALQVCRHLKAPWRWLFGLRVIPRPLRDAAYRFVARHRYQWFGRRATCMVPGPGLRNRFLG